MEKIGVEAYRTWITLLFYPYIHQIIDSYLRAYVDSKYKLWMNELIELTLIFKKLK